MQEREDAGHLDFPDAAAWDAWLADHAETSGGVWLRIGKKGAGATLIGIQDSGDVAICHGWIDSRRRSLDGASFLQRYSPRRPGSPWSLVNVRRAEALIAAGRMRPGGLREIEAARADGRWEAAYAPQRDFAVPEDFAAALDRDARARRAFDGLRKTDRYAILLPILKAARTETRAARIEQAIAKLAPDLHSTPSRLR
jgi:uncharacterized protein YdeI (YjbR/CyaY-like superfamily)